MIFVTGEEVIELGVGIATRRRDCDATVGMSLPPAIEALIAAQAPEIARLRAKVAELGRRLDLDSTTSSKPPSSDGLKKRARRSGSLRAQSGKASGGQWSHKGDTLKRVAEPDRMVRREAAACRHCRAALMASMRTGAERRRCSTCPGG